MQYTMSLYVVKIIVADCAVTARPQVSELGFKINYDLKSSMCFILLEHR